MSTLKRLAGCAQPNTATYSEQVLSIVIKNIRSFLTVNAYWNNPSTDATIQLQRSSLSPLSLPWEYLGSFSR